MIPSVIHQTWKTAEIPERFRAAADSWRRLNPGWSYRFWTDADLDAFVRHEYPRIWPLWRAYPDQIQRVDTARYMILHRLGGVYSDLDIECLRPIESLRRYAAVLARTDPLGVSNDLMMAEPGHPLFARAIDEMERAQQRWGHWWIPRHFRVMLTTASLFLTGVQRRFGDAPSVHLLTPELYSSQDRSRALVYHWPGNTWAGWDTHVFLFIHRCWKWLGRAVNGGRAVSWGASAQELPLPDPVADESVEEPNG